jgi:hypothetical protein
VGPECHYRLPSITCQRFRSARKSRQHSDFSADRVLTGAAQMQEKPVVIGAMRFVVIRNMRYPGATPDTDGASAEARSASATAISCIVAS